MWHWRGIFVVGIYMAVTYEVIIAVGCVLAYLYSSVGSIFPYSIMAVTHIVRLPK